MPFDFYFIMEQSIRSWDNTLIILLMQVQVNIITNVGASILRKKGNLSAFLTTCGPVSISFA